MTKPKLLRARKDNLLLGVTTSTLAAVLVLSACGTKEPDDFSSDTRSGFMAACTRPIEDSKLLADVCGCAFEASTEIPFQEFADLDAALKADDEAPLPPTIIDIVASCFISEAEL